MGKLFEEKSRAGLKIVAEGDSWFAYPAITQVKNLIRHLQDRGYIITNLSTIGHTATEIVYGTILHEKYNYWPFQQIDQTLEIIDQQEPDIVLFSAGGNDIAGDELGTYLNHYKSGLPVLKEGFLKHTIEESLRKAYVDFFTAVRSNNKKTQFIIHGYGYPPVNGDGVGLDLKSINFVGPWLKPAFSSRGFSDRRQNEREMRKVIDWFNDMLSGLADTYSYVHYVDLRKITDDFSLWVNELHLTSHGYKLAAEAFDKKIQEL
ncbi:MAG TPA: SGNH/GDSL hydrolase family protein [Pseudobdellovibrionaceae bacterium]|nr:SGNH/GDSL hydrolase family protein [Pseudobdellovibrionaceae bacterium]